MNALFYTDIRREKSWNIFPLTLCLPELSADFSQIQVDSEKKCNKSELVQKCNLLYVFGKLNEWVIF